MEENDDERDEEQTLVEDDGKRKRNEQEGHAEKIIGIEDSDNQFIPVKRTSPVFTPSNQAKIQLKRGDCIKMENGGQIINATVINRERVMGKFYNYFNVECDDGIIRNIDGERVKWRKLEEEECNMVLIPSNRHRDQDHGW